MVDKTTDTGRLRRLQGQSADLQLARVHIGADEIECIHVSARPPPQARILQIADNCFSNEEPFSLLGAAKPCANRLAGLGKGINDRFSGLACGAG